MWVELQLLSLNKRSEASLKPLLTRISILSKLKGTLRHTAQLKYPSIKEGHTYFNLAAMLWKNLWKTALSPSKSHLRWFRNWRNILLYICDAQIHLARVFFLCILIGRRPRCLVYKDSSFKIRALCADCLGTCLKIVLAVNSGIGWPSVSAHKANISALVLT